MRYVLTALLMLVALRPAAAQDFEGTVTLRLTAPGPNNATLVGAMVLLIKGPKTAAATRIAREEAHIVTDSRTRTRTIWLPKPPTVQFPADMAAAGAVNGLMYTGPIRDPASANPAVTVHQLMTTETIAGMTCSDYDISTPQGVFLHMCATPALGRFVFPDAAGASSNPSAPPSWATAVDAAGVFPLRIWSKPGHNELEVVSVSRHAVPDSVFVVPRGYLDMSKYHPKPNAKQGGF